VSTSPDLHASVPHKMSAAPPVHRSVLRSDPREAGFGVGLLLAVALHAAAVLAAVFLPRIFDSRPPPRRPVIAHLVALGKPRDQSLLPRKESRAPAPVAPASVPSTKPGMVAPSKPAQRQPTRQELMERALAAAARNTSTEKPDPDRAGEATGSANGTAATAEQGDKYFGEVEDAIHAQYVVPSVISERERLYLSANVVVYIGRDGSIVKHVMTKPSGNSFFDQALELAIQRSKLPPPPPELAKLVRDEGLEINFKP
jgi:outer membrane biosynthesis protein TonB